MGTERVWYKKVGTTRPQLVELHGYCDIHTDGTVLSTSDFTGGTWTGDTGVYTLTLAQAYAGVVAIHATVEAATAVDLVAQVKSRDVVTAKKVVIDLNAGAIPTDPSAACRIYLTLVLKRSNATSF